ncbi:MAG: helix-turn-helix transcriptional regulator [Mycobacterium sp.]
MRTETATPKEVAAYLRTSEAGLAQLRYRGTGPKFCRVGPRKVIYRWSDVHAFLEANTCQRTDDPRGAA